MVMKMNGYLPGHSVRKQNYSSHAAQSTPESSTANSAKKKETEKTTETAEKSKSKNMTEYAGQIPGSKLTEHQISSAASCGASDPRGSRQMYMQACTFGSPLCGNKLAELVPSVKFRIGNACVSDKSGKSLTVHPKLLEKMQNDPEKEKDMKDLIKGVESMSKLAESMAKASGWTIVYQHSFIDENGKYHCRMQTRNDLMLNMSDKLREERKKISEKLLEKSKEKAAEKEERSEEALEEKTAEKTEKPKEALEEKTAEKTEKPKEALEEKTAETAGKITDKSAATTAEQLIYEKMAASEDGTIYLYDTDMQTMIEAAIEEEHAGKANTKQQAGVGANLDLQG